MVKTQNQMGWPSINMKPESLQTSALGLKNLRESDKAVNPAEAYGEGENLKTSRGSVKNILNK